MVLLIPVIEIERTYTFVVHRITRNSSRIRHLYVRMFEVFSNFVQRVLFSKIRAMHISSMLQRPYSEGRGRGRGHVYLIARADKSVYFSGNKSK